MRNAIKTGSVSKYPIKEKIPRIKQTIAAISRRLGGFDARVSGFERTFVFEVFPVAVAEVLEVLFFLLV